MRKPHKSYLLLLHTGHAIDGESLAQLIGQGDGSCVEFPPPLILRQTLMFPVPFQDLQRHSLHRRDDSLVAEPALTNWFSRILVYPNQMRADGKEARLQVSQVAFQSREESPQSWKSVRQQEVPLAYVR